MSAVIVGAAAISVVGGMVSANQNAQRQKGMMNSQLDAQRADLAFRDQQYQDAKDYADPLRNQLRDEALQAGPLDYAQGKDQITDQYGLVQRNEENQMAQRGLTGSGIDAGGARAATLRQAGDLSRLWQTGMANKRQLAATLVNQNQPLQMQSAAMLGQGNQNMAGTYGHYADMYGQAAQAGYGAAASGLSNAAYLYGMQNRTGDSGTPPPPIGGAPAPTSMSQSPGYGFSNPTPLSATETTGLVPNVPVGTGWGG